MMKRVRRAVSCVLLIGMLVSAVPVHAAAAGFTDVPADSWAAASIQRAVELGFFQGESDTTFGMGHRMTRAAFAVVLCRFFGWEEIHPAQSTYTDVQDPQAWYYGAVEAGYAHGALTRQTETFRPADPITREELAVMLVRALGYGTIAGLAQSLPMPFTDVRTNTGYIAMAYELGLISGTGATTFSPSAIATREQVAVILMRLYDKLQQGAPSRFGVLPSGEGVPPLTGLSAVAVSGTRVLYSGRPILNASLDAQALQARKQAVVAAGAQALLHVSGSVSVLRNGEAQETAALLADTVSQGGWDGLLLDIPQAGQQERGAMTALVRALSDALGDDRTLYVVAEAPVWDGTAYEGYDYAALSPSADCLVVRVAPYEGDGGFPTAPLEPLEEVYYALAELRGTVPAEKLALMLTTTGTRWVDGKRSGQVDASELEALLADEDTQRYYAGRYACAYLSYTQREQEAVVWYLDQAAVTERVRMAGFFGVDQVCLSDVSSVSEQVLAGLG